MTVSEKVGQLHQISSPGGVTPELRDLVAAGRVGSVINEVDVDAVNELQRVAVEESRLGIPLLIGRDVIHGFRTVFPIPLGLAAAFDEETVRNMARVSALEAASTGVRWTFAPMVDIGRDPRWGRVAECLGEDPYLSGVLAAAMVEGFQGEDLSDPASLAACVKHFAGYGACEGGRDYDVTNVPELELRNVHLPPFRAAIDAGAATLMTSFCDVNGTPATSSHLLLTQILREEWGFDGFVISDFGSIPELIVHGVAADEADAAREAALAGVDMDMAGGAYDRQLGRLVGDGVIPTERLDTMVANVLRMKLRLGLFERPFTDSSHFPARGNPQHLSAARSAASRSLVLVKNDGPVLPLAPSSLQKLAVIGPLADDEYDQMGTWVFDGDASLSQTPLDALVATLGPDVEVVFARGVETTRSRGSEGFGEALEATRSCDATVLILGEEAVLSGEAHCRADIGLPGAQAELVRAVTSAAAGPVVLVVMAGRPLALEGVADLVDAVVMAWHPGSMGGPAIADLLLGREEPRGRLPMTVPKVSGQVPIYYARKNTGRPASHNEVVHMDDLPVHAGQDSSGHACWHLDAGFEPLWPFGYGLSYTTFSYSDLRVDRCQVSEGETLVVEARVRNQGTRFGYELAQLYVRDLVGSVTRPVRELKGFRWVALEPGEERIVRFQLHTDDLAFHGRGMEWGTEPGRFRVWIGSDSRAALGAEFEVIEHRP
jgi:beta-glucosidase